MSINKLNISSISFSEILSISIGLFGLVFAAFPNYSSLALIFPLLAVIYGYSKREIEFTWNKYQTVLVAFYVMFVLSIFWSSDQEVGLKQLEYKLSLLIFPSLFAFRMKDTFKIGPMTWLWLLGLIIATSFGILNACECDIPDLPHRCWVTTRVSPVHHPTYFTIYHTFLLLLIGYAWFKRIKGFKLWWIIPLFVVDLVLHLMFLSMAGILFLGLSIFVLICYSIYIKWGRKVTAFSAIIVILLGFFTLNNIPYFSSDWKGTMEDSMQFVKGPESYIKGLKKPLDGNDQRLVLWTVAAKELANNPLGSGIGSVDKSMRDGLVSLDQSELNEKGMNPHNQYLQVGLELGWWGLIYFVFLIGYLIRLAWKKRNIFTMFLLVNLVFNSFFESMLQRQSGIVFYIFFLSVFMLLNDEKEQSLLESSDN